jgi:hypothetical protein
MSPFPAAPLAGGFLNPNIRPAGRQLLKEGLPGPKPPDPMAGKLRGDARFTGRSRDKCSRLKAPPAAPGQLTKIIPPKDFGPFIASFPFTAPPHSCYFKVAIKNFLCLMAT